MLHARSLESEHRLAGVIGQMVRAAWCLTGFEPLPNSRDGILADRLVKTMRYVARMRRCQYVVQRPESSHVIALVSALLPRLLLDCAQGRIATYVPPATKSAEGAHRGASRIRSGALHIISRNKKLTIRV